MGECQQCGRSLPWFWLDCCKTCGNKICQKCKVTHAASHMTKPLVTVQGPGEILRRNSPGSDPRATANRPPPPTWIRESIAQRSKGHE